MDSRLTDDFDKLIQILQWFKGFTKEQRKNLIHQLVHDYLDGKLTLQENG